MAVGVNPPRTPVTTGSSGMAVATVPNVCKMPGPPAPFVPAPLPNIADSGSSPKGYTKKVKVEGKPTAIKGASFGSKGDVASKGTGGGLVSATTHGTAKFVAPGSMNVKFEGKNVQLLGDATTNNNSNPPNAATVAEVQGAATPAFADAMGDPEIADQLCDAACKAMEDKRQQDAAGTGNQGFQQFMANRLSSGPPAHSPTVNPRILTEATTTIPQRFGRAMSIATSATRTIPGTAAAAPTGLYGGLRLGAQLGRGWTTRWDHVVLNNPAAGCTPNNVSRYVEVKFPNDSLTRNQRRCLIAMNNDDFSKRVEMHPEEDCECTGGGG